MSVAADILEPDAPDVWERDLLRRQVATLDRLAEMGMALAGAVSDQHADPHVDLGRAAIDFSRVARAVRMTLALQSRLVRDSKTPSASAAANDDIAPGKFKVFWLPPDPEPLSTQKSEVADRVRRIAEDAGSDRETVERLALETAERLERDDIDALLSRPFEELVAIICEDLGLTQPSPPPPQAAGGMSGLANDLANPRMQGERSEHPAVEGAGKFDTAYLNST